jgi:penicillin-binding protein 2
MAERLTLKDPNAEKRTFAGRIAVSGLFVFALFGVLVWRYFDLQINQYEKYRVQSDRNRVQLLPIPPRRGLIYDRNGVVLAENQASFSLTVTIERVDNLERTLAELGQLLPIEESDLQRFRKAARERRPYQPVPLRSRLTEQEIAVLAINRHRLPGVNVEAELVRHYPYGELFAHALGYVGRISEEDLKQLDPVNYSGTHYIGKIGVERYYEAQLHGKVGTQQVETNARGRVLRVLERSDPTPGADLRLHLDLNLQKVAQEALGERRGSVVAIDPKTGGVLALVSTPSFDPNLFVNGISSRDYIALRDSPDMPLYNRALQGLYPPGSTMKPIYALAGLHYGIVTAQTRVRDPGFYQLPGDSRHYRDWKRGGHGYSVDLKQSVAESCDVYFYDLAHKLGIDRLHDFTVPFGFGHATGIDNTHERAGIMPSHAWKRAARKQAWFPGETLSAGIGQGYVLATPLQLAVAAATLANRGVRHVPRIVQSIGGEAVDVPLAPIVVSNERHWDTVIDAMREVVHGARGTAKIIAKDAPYEMAGKTGTAQVVGYAQGIKYDASKVHERQRDHALFIAFAPLHDPQIAVGIIVENGEHGSSTAAPIARKLFDAWLLDENGQLKRPPAASAAVASAGAAPATPAVEGRQ